MKSVKKILIIGLFAVIALNTSKSVYAHCEIPCGIYEDTLRIQLIREHITTIEKSMKQIIELSKESTPNYNQIVRWVVNKEEHANQLQEIVSQYFLHQRIKPTDQANKESYEKYTRQLALLHELLVYSMKAKQTTDLSNIEKLRKSTDSFESIYFHKHEH